MLAKEVFIKSLDNVIEYWACKNKEEVACMLGDAVANMVGFDQHNPHHCYNLFEHCLHTVANLDAKASAELKVAAFLHDMGKPLVAKAYDGRLSFHGHAKVSAELVAPLLKTMDFDEAASRKILFLVGHHDDFINYQIIKDDKKWHNAITDENIDRYKNKVMKQNPWLTDRDLKELLRLCKADVGAQSEIVYMHGVFKDSKIAKLARMRAIEHWLFHEPERSR